MIGRSSIAESQSADDSHAADGPAPQRVLITGGLGYLGGRLAVHLTQRRGAAVLLGTRTPRTIDWLPSKSVVQMNFACEQHLRDLCAGVDAVVHLAALNAQQSAADPVGALETNAVATARLVRAASSAGVRRFLYVSTAHVYGSPLRGRIDEQTRPTNLHPYATSHLSGEHSVLFARQKQAITGVVARLSNAFGAPADLHANCFALLVNALCREAILARRMTLANPADRRDFIPMTHACAALEHLLYLGAPLLDDGVFNVGSGQACSVQEIAGMIAAACELECGFRPEIVAAATDDRNCSAPLDYRIDKLLGTGFAAGGDMQAEISATLRMFAQNKELLPV